MPTGNKTKNAMKELPKYFSNKKTDGRYGTDKFAYKLKIHVK